MMVSGMLALLALVTIGLSTASAAPYPQTSNKIKLHGAAGITLHGDSAIGTPVVYVDGKNVALKIDGDAYVVVNQSDIQNRSLDVTVPGYFKLDLQVPNGTIKVDNVEGPKTLVTENGNVIVTNSTLDGDSNFTTQNGSLEFNGQLKLGSTSHFTGVNASIEVTLPGDTKLHLKANASNSGNLTGNFNGLPSNAPQSFDGYLNANPGDYVAELSFSVVNGSMKLNHQ